TLLIWASASLIGGLRLSVENPSTALPQGGAAPIGVEDDCAQEEGEAQPAHEGGVRLLRDDADHARHDERRDQPGTERVRAHEVSMAARARGSAGAGALRRRRDRAEQRAHQATAASIASSASGFSSDERSPGSDPSAFARTARRTIFAERVLGSA